MMALNEGLELRASTAFCEEPAESGAFRHRLKVILPPEGLMCQSFSFAGAGYGDRGDLPRAAVSQRFGAAGQGGARCTHIIHQEDRE